MRYFKYKKTDKNYSIALKEQYNALINDEKRTFRKEKYWRKFSLIVSSVIFFSSVTAGFLLVHKICLKFKTIRTLLLCVSSILTIV